jgi:hypothetical protein
MGNSAKPLVQQHIGPVTDSRIIALLGSPCGRKELYYQHVLAHFPAWGLIFVCTFKKSAGCMPRTQAYHTMDYMHMAVIIYFLPTMRKIHKDFSREHVTTEEAYIQLICE